MSNSLPDFIRNAIIEKVEESNEKYGFASDPDWEPDLEFILTAVWNYRNGVNYRRKSNKKDSNFIKGLKNLPAEKRASILKQLGIVEE